MSTTRVCRLLPLLLGVAHLAAQTTAELVDRLVKANRIDHASTGEGGTRSETYETYELLAAKATTEELLGLTSHRSPAVRGYAVWALSARKARIDWQKLILDHLEDTVEVEELQGCIGTEQHAGDVIFRAARANLDPKQLADIAEHIVRSKCPLHYAGDWVLKNVTFGDSMLPELREMAKAGDAAAAVAVARFHRDADVASLVQQLQQPDPFDDDTKFLAAAASKDARLLAPLRALIPEARGIFADGEDTLRPWLEAIAAQETAAAAVLLLDIFALAPRDAERPRLLWVIADVLKAHPAPVFDTVRKQVDAAIKEAEWRHRLAIFDKLLHAPTDDRNAAARVVQSVDLDATWEETPEASLIRTLLQGRAAGQSEVELLRRLFYDTRQHSPPAAVFVEKVEVAYVDVLRRRAMAELGLAKDGPSLATWANYEDTVRTLAGDASEAKDKAKAQTHGDAAKQVFATINQKVEELFTPAYIARVSPADLLADPSGWEPTASDTLSVQFDRGAMVLSNEGGANTKTAGVCYEESRFWRDYVVEFDFRLDAGRATFYTRAEVMDRKRVPGFSIGMEGCDLVLDAYGQPRTAVVKVIGGRFDVEVRGRTIVRTDPLGLAMSRKGPVAIVLEAGTRLVIARFRIRHLR